MDGFEEDFPYRAEYAKSGRSSCKGCKTPIGQGLLRLAVMVQSPMFDARVPYWYHMHCFFSKQRPKSVDDIHHYETLKLEDQNKIRSKVATATTAVVPDGKKGKKRDASSAAAKKAALKDFRVEYAKSGRAVCRGCELKILKDEVRIAKKDFTTEVGMKYGGQDMWHHLTCFAQLRNELGYFESADKLPGFSTLSKEDQKSAKKQLPAIKQEEPVIKKGKTEDASEDVVDGYTPEEYKIYTAQAKIMDNYRTSLSKLKKADLQDLLEYNRQQIAVGHDRCVERLCDVMTFGVLLPCKECAGQLVFDKFGYRCTGDMSEFTKCKTLVKIPDRVPFQVPSDLAEKFAFLDSYEYQKRTRVIKAAPPNYQVKKDEPDGAGPKVQRQKPALYNMEFVILGKPSRGKDLLKKEISKLGGKVVTKISSSVMAVFASEEDVEKMGARMSEVQSQRIHVVPEKFIDEAPKHSGKIPDLITKLTICDWGSDPTSRLPQEPSTSSGASSGASKSRSLYTRSMPSRVKLTLKGGTLVDPDSGLQDVAHVYHEGKVRYSLVLSKTDIQSKKNSYYKLQLLQPDRGGSYHVFRSWGRIGTTIGSNKLEKFGSINEAKHSFRDVYLEKTGNAWEDRDHFVKVPGKFCPIDIDYGEEDGQNFDIVEADSKLKRPIQELIRLIFDVNAMKKLMVEFELDLEKMPLGKLSKKQIQKAFGILSELKTLCDQGGAEARFVDATNKFYTVIPHSFGIDNPPVLNDPEMIKKKLDMLDNLMEIEIAYSMMQSTGSEHTVDTYYDQLNTEIDVLDRESEEFKIIEEYVQNTHAATHANYKLVIQDVYTVKRRGEDKRFKPFKKLHNHKLLWHGSRTTNIAGILSQGLRIAPPEAPVTGYMFGKGIYFADMVSKSANYCNAAPDRSTAVLLLCDVALGNMAEHYDAVYIEKLPKGKHSTKGVGRTQPDPKGTKNLDGVDVPCGKAIQVDNKKRTVLLYNEYIIYDVAQVNMKYLLKVEFKFK